ncbi:MAG: GntR family transcriptional regulator [Actinomycetota bacterium]
MSTSAQVEAAIVERLLDGRYGPGDWIRQDALAAELDVSKIPVREALHRLAGEGMLRFETNRGVRVPELDARTAREVFALRQGVERALLDAAIGKHSIVDLAEAQHALERVDVSPTAANWAFHAALYRPAGWERGLRIAHSLHATVAGYVVRYLRDLHGDDDSGQEHRTLLDCCREQDRDGAQRVLGHHLTTAADALIEQLELLDVPHEPFVP